jgi:hypothetical protein
VEPLTPSLPPPNPAPSSNIPRTLAPELNDYHRYSESAPPPVSPAVAGPQYHATGPPSASSPHTPYPVYNGHSLPPPRSGPENGYGADRSRASASPNTHVSGGTPGTAGPTGHVPPYSATGDGPTSAAPAPAPQAAAPVVAHGNPAQPGAEYQQQQSVTLPPPQPSSTPTAAQVNGNGGHISPTHHSNNTTSSPTSAHPNGRPGMSIRDIVSNDGRTAPDIDSAMKARLNLTKSYAVPKQ